MVSNYEYTCRNIDDIVGRYDDEQVFFLIQLHAVLRRFFGVENLFKIGYDYGAAGDTPADFTPDVRRRFLNSLALKYHPDKGGDVKHCQYFLGPFKEFVNDDHCLRLYAMYLCAPDTFHLKLESKKKYVTYELIELPEGFTEVFVPEESDIIPEPLFPDR
uniref:J domain-containing protein n=1 Tax=Panagrolaimus sp. ES5 TaxID=591445 RepID=A0AC34FW18_9BILA